MNKGKTLQHAGQVGTGLTQERKAIFQKLKPLVSGKHCPLSPKPRIKGVTWVEPELVCESGFWNGPAKACARAGVPGPSRRQAGG